MYKHISKLLLLSVVTAAAHAHPGIGIVEDRHGNVFFTDTKQVWKIAPDGRMSVAVPGVHTHELCVDSGGNLYGEHLWYEGDAIGRWAHRVWRLSPDGTISDVIPTRNGFLADYSLVRDHAGNMYWADRGTATVIRKRSPEGAITTHATADFRAVGWMTATPDGTLFLMDAGDLRRVSPDGQTTTIATRLSGQNPPPEGVRDLNYHMGLWTHEDGGVYVAVAAERQVLRVDLAGNARVVARSVDPWSPSGGMFDRDGHLWLLEYDPTNAVRVRRLDQTGSERVFPTTASAQRGQPM